jgi:hypothetical protein
VGVAKDKKGKIFNQDEYIRHLTNMEKRLKSAFTEEDMNEIMRGLVPLRNKMDRKYHLAEKVSNFKKMAAERKRMLYGDKSKNEPGLLGLYRQLENYRIKNAPGISREAMVEFFRIRDDLRNMTETLKGMPINATASKVLSGKATKQDIEKQMFRFQAMSRRYRALREGYSRMMPCLQQAVGSSYNASSHKK